MSASNIQVAIKVRPILGNEKEQKQASFWKIAGNSIQLIDGHSEPFYFDHIFDQDVSNQVIFNTLAKQIVDSGMKGFNGTIFAYGQTSSGKTYTMMGEKDNPGVMELATKEIFKEIEKAIDRQFLLRVGYIEIYNEKIYDLLNKSNQDLKIHETPNGDVGVNCSEYIITCEEDLLSYLRLGSKQRKIGNTNMNDRSSRSHAIFRIIIESRKTDKTDEDSVSISILNLVDLAGSERADQTGAIGSRLKEGGHINKSLLFLSCVIKKLTEDKYVNYRDSKLTRILQASLGGNALTAIICTINPTAIDETLSTLNFANRAKAVKNKPQVNEVLTDAAMMKRLEKEINRLQNELTVEKTKNSLIKVGELQKRLNEQILKIINSNSSHHFKELTEKRRRTWCPSSAAAPIPEVNSVKPEAGGFVPPTMASQMPTKLQLPKSIMNFTPHITLRDAYYQEQFKEIQCSPNIDEEFIPADEVFFDDVLTPRTSSPHLKEDFHTPDKIPELRTASLTPRLTEKECLLNLERELKELETFTNLENKLNVEHEPYNALKQKLENAEVLIARYVKEREDYALIKLDYDEAQGHHTYWQERCKDHESKIIELEAKASEFESASKSSKEEILRYEKEVTDLKAKVTQLEMENREAVSLEFEFQQHKNKSKRRETELLGALEEKQKEINKLQQSLQTVTNKALNNSKEELHHISRSCDEAETVCIKCKDLQQILSENKQLIQDFENVNLEYKSLQLNLEKISSEVESEKLRADSLHTENACLKKDAEQLTSIYGSLEEVQNQIGSLQAEKCKLDSVKIEFEVMSKETANKTAEKINISQDIETLKSQKETLTAECDKLQRDLNSNGCVTEELNKLRIENAFLHSELQTITTKLEAAQSDYVNLLTENQTKSDSYEKLNMEVALARNELEKLQTECHDTQQKYEQIQVEYNKREGTIGEIQSEYDSIQFKYQCLQREYEKLENDSVQSIADCDRVQTQNENLETEIRELKTKVEEAQRKLLENDSLQVELESMRLEMNRLQGEYEKKRKSASPSKEENNVDLRQENIKLKHDLDNLQLQFNEMQTEYDDLSSQLVDNLADYESLQNDVAKLQTELENYKTSTADAEEFKTMKNKIAQLQAENQHLIKENSEWEKTISSMSKSMKDKCDEREKLVAELEEIRNDSARSTSTLNCDQFSSLSESFVKIEMPTGNGISRTFLAAGAPKSATGSRMIIGSVSGITQGAFDELHSMIEFAVPNNDCKSNNEIYDSLEMEENSASPNSCDSLESNSRRSNEAQINELVEEKSRLFEKIRSLEEAVSLLKIENEKLANIRMELAETHSIVEQLNSEKLELNTICDKNKFRINELNEIISQRECDNKKLIADYLELKQSIGSNNFIESVPKEMYEKLQHQHEDTCKKLHAHESKIEETVREYEEMSAVLKSQLQELQSKPKYRAVDENTEVEKSNSDSEYKEEIAAPEKTVKIMVEQLEKNIKNETVSDTPTYSELKETISKLHEQLQACKCTELEASLYEKTQQLAELRDNKTVKYEQHICELLEQLKQQECKFKEVQIEIIELKTSLEGKTQESKERADKIEQLNGMYAKMQTEYDDLQEELISKNKNSAVLENSVQKCNQDINLLQNSVASLNEAVATLRDERNEILRQKEALEKEYKTVNEQLCLLKNTSNSLSETKGEINEMRKQFTLLEEKYELVKVEKENVHEEFLRLHEQNKQLNERCEILKNSEKCLNEQLQKLVQDHELIVRDKENLARERDLSNEEFEKLQKKYESHLKTQHELQQKCEELEEKFNKVTQEREKLEIELVETKGQREKLKENHNSERKSLEEKCSSLTREIQLLTNTKNEIQSALDKAKHHSEFLLQQGKDLEEQLNQDLCTVRNSNNSMAQRIDELEEKLDKAETELKIALVKTTSERDEVILQLTNTNNSLVTKSSELEEKLAFLNQQLDESKEFLLSETNMKSILEKKIFEKDELIEQLSNENSSLTSKGLELEKQLEESKRSLKTEAHQKQVLEKANSERDDLIIQLTNNNNSLAIKSTELEEKLAILENQFEESKRRLSTEVTKLNLSLDTANRMHAIECAKVVDLTFKIETLETEIKKTQNSIAQRDSLLEKLNEIQIKYNDLAIQHANLELNRSTFEAEINSARAVVIENANLTEQLNAIKSTLNEMQLKCSSLTTANKELDSINKALTKKVESTNQQAQECNRLKDEIAKIEKDLKITQEQLSKSEEQLKTNFTEWNSKEQSFTEQILKLQSNVAILSAEKKSIQEKLNSEEKLNLSKITQLEEQIQLLQKEGWNVKAISPKKNNVLSKNMNLMEKLDSSQKSQNEERKIRRLSAHDERRRQTFWDSNRDISTMTDPTNAACNCEELDRKLNELKQKLLIRDSQVNTLSMELKNHPLKMENATLKNLLMDEESKQYQLRQELKRYNQLIVSKANESRQCAKCTQASKRIVVDSTTQTLERDETECYRKLQSKYEDLKMICRGRHVKIKELEKAMSTGKENANDNVSPLQNQQYRQKYELLNKEFVNIREKYEEAKILCNKRYEQIRTLTSQLSEKS